MIKIRAKAARRLALLTAGVLVTTLAVSGLHASPVAAATGTLSISPATQTVTQGSTFSVTIQQASSVATSGAQADLVFDKTKVTVVDVARGSAYAGPPLSGATVGFGDLDVAPAKTDAILLANVTSSTLAGTSVFYATSGGQPSIPAGTNNAIVVTLRACAPTGSTPLTLSGGEMLDATGASETVSVTGATVTITAGGPADGDCDGVVDATDVCPALWDTDQTNTDAAAIDNGPLAPGNDATLINSDVLGNLCDPDIDNDGISNTAEASGASCGAIVTNPLLVDTDGDHLADGWECSHGSDPTNAASKFLGTGATDADGDHIADVWEQRGYNGSSASTDADGDGCADVVEMASIDGNKTVGDPDRLSVARRALGIWGPNTAQDYALDIDKNGVVGDPDRIFVARAALLPDWLPKSCP